MLTEAEIIILFRSLLAALVGLFIGWERRAVRAPVRGRIISLTTMTAAAITAVGAVMYPTETSRIVAGIVTGVGFLGAGVILRSSTGQVRGQATAAALWAMSCIGIVIGTGHEVLGIILSFIVYVIIAWGEWPLIKRLNQRLAKKKAKESESQQSNKTENLVE